MIIDMFVNSGHELSNIHTVGKMDETLHLGVMRYVAAYDNAEEFVNNAYSDYRRSKSNAVRFEFDAFCTIFICNGYTIITAIRLDDEFHIQREKKFRRNKRNYSSNFSSYPKRNL